MKVKKRNNNEWVLNKSVRKWRENSRNGIISYNPYKGTSVELVNYEIFEYICI